jgi:palmitoyltransferase
MIFTAYLIGVFGWVVAHYKGDAQLFVAIGLAGFFCLFTTGMVLNSLNMVFKNTTTIETSDSRRMYMAVVLPPERQIDPLMLPPPPAKLSRSSSDGEGERPITSELDDESHINYFKRQNTSESRPPLVKRSTGRKIWKGSITYPLHLPVDRPPIPAIPQRHFAILQLPPGLNPFNLGSAYRNFTAVFGTSVLDWILPIKHSPCCDHSSRVSEYPLGPEFELMLADAGLVRPISPLKERRPSTTPSRKRKRRLDPGWQNGERPPGWISEQEARRMRKEWRHRADQSHHPDRI